MLVNLGFSRLMVWVVTVNCITDKDDRTIGMSFPGTSSTFQKSDAMPNFAFVVEVEERRFTTKDIASYFGLGSATVTSTEGWRFRDRTHHLFQNMTQEQGLYIQNHPVHRILLERVPNKMRVSDFVKRVIILFFHLALKKGRMPFFWQKSDFKRQELLARLAPIDDNPRNNPRVALEAHTLWVKEGRPIAEAIETVAQSHKTSIRQEFADLPFELVYPVNLPIPPGFDPSALPIPIPAFAPLSGPMIPAVPYGLLYAPPPVPPSFQYVSPAPVIEMPSPSDLQRLLEFGSPADGGDPSPPPSPSAAAAAAWPPSTSVPAGPPPGSSCSCSHWML